MERRERETFVSPTEETVPLEAERTVAAPRFDEKSIQRARPAVPLTLGGRLRSWPPAVVVFCLLGGVAGGVLGGLVLTLYQSGGQQAGTEGVRPRQDYAGATAGTSAPAADTVAPAAPPQADGPAAVDAQPAVVNAGTQPADGARTTTPVGEPDQAARADAAVPAGGGDGAAVEPDASTEGELRSALGEWVAATNARDVGRQMSFYAPTVDAFYLSRNASREAVRAEKSRVFAAAQSVNVRAAQPEIRLSRDGRTAVMRFRKSYQITGGGGARSGEVLQELRWRRTPSGWKIVSERDLRVLD